MKLNRLFILPFLLPLFGFVEILKTRTDSFVPRDTTSLKSFGIKVIEKRFRHKTSEPLSIANYMTDVRITLKTQSISQINDYGVVQFIKGCKWESIWNGSQLEKLMSISRDHFGEPTKFIHRDWEVDTDSYDPVYQSYDGDRFALWRWNQDARSDNPETATFTHFKPTPHPTVFLTDQPGTSYKSATSTTAIQTAKNSTLHFKSCLFKMSDLPETTDRPGSNIDMSRAIHCFEWKDKWVFNFQTQSMSQPEGIDSICF